MKIILQLRAVSGTIFIEVLLMKIALVKEIMLYDLEKGYDILIPNELSQANYPYSFRYYDPIIAIIQENFSEISKDHLTFKQLLAYQLHMNSDLKYKFLNLIGIISNNDKKKLIHKYQPINEKVEPGIDHYNSIHTRSL